MDILDDASGLRARELNALQLRGRTARRRVDEPRCYQRVCAGPSASSAGRDEPEPLDIGRWREIEAEKLNALEAPLLDGLTRPRPLVAWGRIVTDPSSGDPILERGVNLAIVDRLLRIANRRAALQGIDMPRLRETELVTSEMLDAEIQKIARQADKIEADTAADEIERIERLASVSKSTRRRPS